MNKFLTLSIFFLGLLCSCSNCDLQENEPASDVAGMQQNMRSSFYTPEQIAFLERLDQISDSIAENVISADEPASITTRAASIDMRAVSQADMRGAYEGFKFGWRQGKGIFGRFATATLNALISSVCYSASEISRQLTGILASAPPYSINTIEGALAVQWTESNVNNRWRRICTSDPELNVKGAEEELKIALLHNLTLEELSRGVVYPTATIKSLFSDDQLTYFSSRKFETYFNASPKLAAGTVSFSSYLTIDPFPYETEVFNAYVAGVKKFSTTDQALFLSQTKALCKQYVEEVSTSDLINADASSSLISSFFVAPLSIKHWTSQ